MTTPPPIERDKTGRFVKPDTLDTPDLRDDDMHPVSRLLFGWVEGKRTPILLLAAVSLICFLLILVDLVLNRHEYVALADMTGFYGLWGFGGFALAVLSGWPLGKLLRRGEDYYGEADTRPADVEADE